MLRPRVLFCSIVASNFLAHARVLADSLRRAHPEARLELFVVDAWDEPPRDDEPFSRIALRDAQLSTDELHRRATMYDRQALVSSLKPRVLAGAIERSSGPVVLLDADMLALGALEDVFDLAARHAIVLSPHATTPMPFEPGGYGPEQTFLRAGVFNGGFLGISAAAGEFLEWWDERCALDCVWDLDRGILGSQAWLTLVPALFDHCVLRDRGVNLTCHGLGADDLSWADDTPFIGELPVRLFHFAGEFGPRAAELSQRPGMERLRAEYRRLLLDAGYDETAEAAFRYATLPDMTPIDWAMRAAYRKALMASAASAGAAEPPNPSHAEPPRSPHGSPNRAGRGAASRATWPRCATNAPIFEPRFPRCRAPTNGL